MCWERLDERRTDDVETVEPREVETPRQDIEWPTVRRTPTEEPVETEEELARV